MGEKVRKIKIESEKPSPYTSNIISLLVWMDLNLYTEIVGHTITF